MYKIPPRLRQTSQSSNRRVLRHQHSRTKHSLNVGHYGASCRVNVKKGGCTTDIGIGTGIQDSIAGLETHTQRLGHIHGQIADTGTQRQSSRKAEAEQTHPVQSKEIEPQHTTAIIKSQGVKQPLDLEAVAEGL